MQFASQHRLWVRFTWWRTLAQAWRGQWHQASTAERSTMKRASRRALVWWRNSSWHAAGMQAVEQRAEVLLWARRVAGTLEEWYRQGKRQGEQESVRQGVRRHRTGRAVAMWHRLWAQRRGAAKASAKGTMAWGLYHQLRSMAMWHRGAAGRSQV